jgi:hypothetical protein
MSLGNMRAIGVRSLDVCCWLCRHRAILGADPWRDHVPVPNRDFTYRTSEPASHGGMACPKRGVSEDECDTPPPDTNSVPPFDTVVPIAVPPLLEGAAAQHKHRVAGVAG